MSDRRPRRRKRFQHRPAWVVGPVSWGYSETLAVQEALETARLEDEIPDTLLLVEHPPGAVMGWGPGLPGDPELPRERRGGGPVLHGPGMLSGYLVMDLEEGLWDLRYLAKRVSRGLTRLLGEYHVDGELLAGLPGVWVEGARLADVGLGLRERVTRFGFTLALTAELEELLPHLPEAYRTELRCTLAGSAPWPVELPEVVRGLRVHLGSYLALRFEPREPDELLQELGLPPLPWEQDSLGFSPQERR